MKQLFAKGGHLAVRDRPAWWLWQRRGLFYKGCVVGSGVHGGWRTLWGIPGHLWDQEKRHLGHMNEASVGRPVGFLSFVCSYFL